mgnify:CR=1 FL=1
MFRNVSALENNKKQSMLLFLFAIGVDGDKSVGQGGEDRADFDFEAKSVSELGSASMTSFSI